MKVALTIRLGLILDIIDSNKTTSLTYYFSVSVQNNIIDAYSDYSNLSSIVITKPNSSIAIKLIPQTSGYNYNNKILATWNAPSNGNRGIVNAQTNTGLPTLNRYTLNSINLKNVNADGGFVAVALTFLETSV